jgi:hypothetical protein
VVAETQRLPAAFLVVKPPAAGAVAAVIDGALAGLGAARLTSRPGQAGTDQLVPSVK